MPVTVGYRFGLTDDISLSVFTGAQLNYGFSLRYKAGGDCLNIYDHFKEIEENYGQNGGFRRVDYQWLFGARMHYGENYFAEVSGGIGFGNIFYGNMGKQDSQRRSVVSVGLGYAF